MLFCTQCGASVQDSYLYCGKCGKQTDSSAVIPHKPFFQRVVPGNKSTEGPIRRFGRLFGLDPRIAILTLIVDMMLNAGDLASMGLLAPVSIAAGVALGFVVYRAQINWYGDDPESAKIKAIILGLLTAIPTPLPEILYVPAGIVGLVRGFWRKESRA
jgi:zinc-ribbon domain